MIDPRSDEPNLHRSQPSEEREREKAMDD